MNRQASPPVPKYRRVHFTYRGIVKTPFVIEIKEILKVDCARAYGMMTNLASALVGE